MWVLIVTINVYNGFVIWFIERDNNPELKGSVLNQLGTLMWLAFRTLFSIHGTVIFPFFATLNKLLSLILTSKYITNASYITLINLNDKGERIHSNLSQMTMVVWVFVALVIMQTYTANLTTLQKRLLLATVRVYYNNTKSRHWVVVPTAKSRRCTWKLFNTLPKKL